MNSDSIVILGVPVDNLDMEETISRLFSMARAYDEDGRPRMAVAVTAETIMRLRKSAHKIPAGEATPIKKAGFQINTLRSADLMIPVGLPVVWASRILGIKLKKRISAAGFFHHFLETALSAGKSTLLLQKSPAPKQSSKTDIRYDGFTLTRPELPDADGCAINGQDVSDTGRSPASIPYAILLESMHEYVNSAGADFLIIDINNPDLAAWFEQSKNRIHVPVILLVSGTGEIHRAARKIRYAGGKPGAEGHLNIEKQSFYNGFAQRMYHHYVQLGLLLLPLVLYQKYNQAVFSFRHQPSTIPSIKSASPKTLRGLSIKVISMPDPLDASVTEDIRAKIRKMSQIAPKVVLDFSRVNFMDSSGLGLLMGLCRASSAEKREIFLTGVKPKIYHFFKLTKTIDFFEDRIMQSLFDIVETIRQRVSNSSFYYLSLIRSNAVVLNLYGKLDAAELMDINAEIILEQVSDKDAIINLADLAFMDSAGIRFLVKLHRHVSGGDRILILCGMQGKVRRLFSIVGLDRLFVMENSLPSAELALRRHHIRRFAPARGAAREDATSGRNFVKNEGGRSRPVSHV